MKKDIEIKEASLFYHGHNLLELAKTHDSPLKITFLDIIKEKILMLKSCFEKSIAKNNYKGNFIYLNANKANYSSEVLKTAGETSDGYEISSYMDLIYTEKIIKLANLKNKMILCNGHKNENYLIKMVDLINNGYNLTSIMDSYAEFEFFKNLSSNKKTNIGLRIHLPRIYGENAINDRFGITPSEFEKIIKELKNLQNLTLTTIHFHQRGMDYEEDKFIKNLTHSFQSFYVPAKAKFPSLCNFDIGGGTPLPLEEDFNYQKWSDLTIKTIKQLCRDNKIDEPNLISENGKYTVKDSAVTITKVVGVKNTDVIPWYIINSSLFTMIPEYYECGEPMLFRPVNLYENKMIKTRLAGETCDCDDIFFESNGFIKMPQIDENQTLYVALLGCGSYQDSVSGRGGIHHCLMPEEKRIIVHTKNGKTVVTTAAPLQTITDISRLTNCTKKYLKNF